MQTLTIYQNTPDGLQIAGPEHGPASGALARLKASQELEHKSVLMSMQDNAVRHKEQGNAALAKMEYRHAIREYNQALKHARAMMDFLEVDRPAAPLNGYQLRALARGQELPKRGPEALDPFRALLLANRSFAFLCLDAYKQAIEDAADACRLLPKYLKAWIRRAAALAAANQRDNALVVLDEALDKACPDTATKEQVCKLIVNIRSLGQIDVKAPQPDLPVVHKEDLVFKREVVKAPAGMSRSPAPKKTSVKKSLDRILPSKGSSGAARDAWYSTHLGGRWRQGKEDVTIVICLPRRPKASELLVQIRPNRLWVMLRKLDATGHAGQDDFETMCDAQLLRTVKPSESTWILEPGSAPELHVTLQKQAVLSNDSTGPELWDRAFANDDPVDTAGFCEP